jgi:diguanylate cyclase (GGDEF)-like protein/PAS domain S-box-containing protein
MFFPVPANESERIAALRKLNILDSAAEKDFDQLAELAALICGTPISTITLIDEHRQWIKSSVGIASGETPRETAFCAHTIVENDILTVPDAAQDVRFAANPFVTGEPHVRFYAGMPIISDDGLALGSICVIDRIPRTLRNDQEQALRIIARQVMALIKARFQAVMMKTVNQQLQTSEQSYRFLAETIPQQVWAARADGFINYGNRRAMNYFGEGVLDELSGMQWHKVIHPDDLARTEARWRDAVTTGANYETEYRLLRHDGEYRWHLSQAAPMRDAAGAIRKWYGTNTDIHDRKVVESALREAEGYRNLFQHANDAILILDLETEIVLDVNEKACEMYGFAYEEFVGKSMREISQNASHGDKFRRELVRAGDYQTFETVQHRADDTALELLVNSSVIDYHGRKVILSINRDITERNRTDRLLTHNALHDALTRLPNRTLFTEHLRHAIERGARQVSDGYAVLFLDFDRFKIINDSLGHNQGDNLLIMFAERLKAAVRPSDIVARLGGDEFTILLDELDHQGEAETIAGRIHDSLKKPFFLGSNEVFLSASIGIAFGHTDYREPGDVLRDADIAMYRAKTDGRSRTIVFNQEMHSAAIARLQLEGELRQALERREFCVYYQPIVNYATDRIKGFEALVRWRHPSRGFISPIEFIPLAEDTGLIIPLGEFVLRESCRQLSRWQKQAPTDVPLTMSVNLSCKQFMQPNLVEMVAAILEETNLSADCLRLEVTESYLMDDTEAAITIMHRLRELGVKLSLDDFGTGYSSLSYLHRLPLDYLKIDRSFVSRMKPGSEDLEIVRTVIGLAQNLHLKTIAEGVETEGHAQQLKDLNCDYGQGFLYSKPIPADEVDISDLNISIKPQQAAQTT